MGDCGIWVRGRPARWLPDPGDSRRGLDRATMEQALVWLGELAAAEGYTLTLVVAGGAAS